MYENKGEKFRMNVLICNSYKVYKTQGGTERISSRVAQGLTALGHQCFLAYKCDKHLESPETCFVKELDASKSSLESFILKNRIDVVIIQKMTRDVRFLYHIRKLNGLSFRIISVLHFAPAFEEYNLSFKAFYSGLWHYYSLGSYIKDFIRTIAYPFYKLLYPLRNKNLYRMVYFYSDKVVLLSQSFVEQYKEYAKLKEIDKFSIIPNTLSFDDYLDASNICDKKEQVLVVSRLVENPKRISLVIKIWKGIEKDHRFDEWSLNIVGDGEDKKKYEQMVNDYDLKRVCFCGRKNPKSYYKDSSLFIMTSAFEGWGLTLTEAQQFGCVPLAFDTYSSVHDIIDNGKNGYIIENDDINKYVERLKKLMLNEDLRKKMAKEAIASSKRFELTSVIMQWETLIMK